MSRSMLKGYIYIVLSAVIFGCMPLMAKNLYQEGVNSITLVTVRNVISLPFLLGIALVRRETLAKRGRDVFPALFIGILGCALTPFLLFSSYLYMDSGAATVLHFVYPAAVLLLEFIFVRGSVRGVGALSIALCVLGLALFYNPAEGLSLEGSVLALTSGVTYALYIFLLGRFGRRGMGSFAFAFFATLGASAVILAVGLIGGMLSLPSTLLGWLLCVLFALVINVGAVMLFQGGAFIVGGQRAAILSTLEPITSLLVGFIAFSERVSVFSLIGSALILCASVLTAVADEKAAKKRDEKKS